ALAFSGAAPALIVAVGVAVLVRRGWRMAALQTVPLAVVYLAWSVLERADLSQASWLATPWRTIITFVRTGVASAFGGAAPHPLLGVLLGIGVGVGLILATAGRSRAELRRRFALPVALLV